MRILFIVPNPPSLVRVRPYNLIKQLLGLGHDVTVATLWTNEEERADIERLKQEYRVDVISRPLPSWRSLWNCVRALASRVPLQALYCWQPQLARALLEAHKRSPFDIIHVEHLRGTPYGLFLYDALKGYRKTRRSGPHPPAAGASNNWRRGGGLRAKSMDFCSVFSQNLPLSQSWERGIKGVRASRCRCLEFSDTLFIRNPQSAIFPPIVWDSVDCISHLFEQSAKKSRSLKGRLMASLDIKRTRRYEGWLLDQFDRVLVTSMKDKAALQALACKASTALNVLPNGVALDYFTPSSKPREPATLLISGKMSYHANVTAALHLVQDIMPHVWAERPSIQVQIVGKDPPRNVQALASGDTSTQGGVTVTGTVPDIRPYLRAATISVVPLTYGAGIQNKVLEAMACATPVVATPLAASGLAGKAIVGRDLMVAEGAEALAQTLLALLSEPARRAQIGQAGRAYVERHHSWEAIGRQLEAFYETTIAASNESLSLSQRERAKGMSVHT